MHSRKASPARPKPSPQRNPSPIRKENCSKSLLTAVLSHLSVCRDLQNEPKLGYYQGGYYHLAKTEGKTVPKETDLLGKILLATPLSSTLGSYRHWLSPKLGVKQVVLDGYKQGKEARSASAVCRPGSRLQERQKSTKRFHETPHSLATPKLFSFTGPLVSFQPTVVYKKQPIQRRFKRIMPTKRVIIAESEAVTCINVRIPTPKFKDTARVIATEEFDRKELASTHKRAISHGDGREVCGNPLQNTSFSTKL